MTLPSGTRLGHYEILAPLGAGGMGVVYKARDPRLDRYVAVKVLAAHLSSSPQARQRFDREAKLVSQLSHPNVCALFDVGHDGGTDFLVMELLEGEPLSDRLGRGPLPFADVLRHGTEIADALDKAHAAGIVHRDLKPANVMLTKSGVKLLDFGLAKALEDDAPAQVSAAVTASIETAITQEGAVIGTLQYMSPEQVDGRPADARSDIFALGAVLYEMAAGRRPFSGDSRAAIASAILSGEPEPLSSVKPLLPAAFTRLVRTCLEKEPARRWQSAHDVGLQLRALADPEPSPPSTRRPQAVPWLPWAIAAAAVVAAGVALVQRQPAPAASAPAIRFRVPPPDGRTFLETVEVVPYAISPDGTKLVMAAHDPDGTSRLWLRPLSSADAKALPGTEGAITAFWSPDSGSIAFFAGGKLKRLDLSSGGPALAVCDVRRDVGLVGSWGTAGQILFASIEGEAIYGVPTGGGTPTVILARDPAQLASRVSWPSFLPDGRRFLYLDRGNDDGGEIRLFEPGQPTKPVRPGLSAAHYVAAGHIVFAQDGTLVGQPFDAERGVVTGEPFPIAEPVLAFTSSGWASFSAAQNGTLAFASSPDRSRLAWFDRSGKEVAQVPGPSDMNRLRIERSGRRVLFDRAQPASGTLDLWTADLARNTETHVTTAPGSEIAGAWLPDGSGVFFSASRGGPPHIYGKDLASGAERRVTKPSRLQFVLDVSPDGKTLLYQQRTDRGDMDLFTLAIDGGEPAPLVGSTDSEVDGTFSPDGRAVAYLAAASGAHDIYVRPFPGAAVATRVTTGGGELPRWSRDRKELYYVDAKGWLNVVPVRTSPGLEVGQPAPLFAIPDPGWRSFVATPDGSRFLAIVPEAEEIRQPLTVVVNGAGGVRTR